MSEIDARPAPSRGRSSTRGGRGGFGRGGPRGSRKPTNGTQHETLASEESLEDQGELGELKKKFIAELAMLKELFPDWTDTDLVFALQESNGDVGGTVEKITQGQVSQFAEVRKNKDRARSKAKEEAAPTGAHDKSTLAARGSRGRGGSDATRGGRGRGAERGRGGHRGGRAGHATTNGAKDGLATSVPTQESTAWDTAGTVEAANGGWDHANADATKEVVNVAEADTSTAAANESVKSSLVPQGGPSWASMLRTKPVHAPVPVTKSAQPQQPQQPTAHVAESILESAPAGAVEITHELEPTSLAIPQILTAQVPTDSLLTNDLEEMQLTPSKDPLTEENVEHLPDESNPLATQTVASTTGSMDPRNLTPLPSHQAPVGRPQLSGYAATASRLAGPGRSASFQRRVQEQQEAVVMPGHNSVDKAAVQFGSMGLNGEPGLDVDDDREDAETRQQPQHSPPSQPRASLPPAPRQSAAVYELGGQEGLPTPKQAPGLPPASAQNQQQMQDPSLIHNVSQDQQVGQTYGSYGRYGQSGAQQDTAAQQPKPYDPFSHQAQQNQYDQYAGHSQPQQQQHAQSGFQGGLSSAQNDYSSYYTHDQQSRNAYNQYYGNAFGPQDGRGPLGQGQGQHDPTGGQQRSSSGFGAGHNDAAFAPQQQQASSRFGETPGSGNNTPNPLMGGQQPPASQTAPNTQQSQQAMHQAQQHQQGGYAGASSSFPYGHPYYNSPYQQAYQNQFGYSHPLGGYGGGYPAKQSSAYPQSHNYNMGSQPSYEQHSASPANANAFGQNQAQSQARSTSGTAGSLGSGLDEYNRGSGQSISQQNNAFGGMSDPFARATSGFGQNAYAQQPQAGPDESLKPFGGDAKSGPTPQPGRPGSAANSTGANTQSGLPPPQQGGFGGGGYSGFPGQGSQYGGLGGLGQQSHQQNPQQSAYGGYGGFNQTYGAYGNSRGGWGQNYGGGH